MCFLTPAFQGREEPIVRPCLFKKRQLLFADGGSALREATAGGGRGQEGVRGLVGLMCEIII